MKRLKKTLALALASALCLGIIAPTAHAAEGYTPNAAITKVIEVPVGTTLPDPMDFEFEIKAQSWDSVAFDGANMPTFANVTLRYSADMLAVSQNAAAAGVSNPYTEDGTTYYVLESGNIFDRMSGSWLGAGKYEYAITEKPGTYTINSAGATADFTEGMNWSNASYTL
ncbi:MAG: hypothetical protein FWD72_02915, partial [Eggerthellaceae bacterium]|nr:hypothetical protein [Eggerthellaceae bacterium]